MNDFSLVEGHTAKLSRNGVELEAPLYKNCEILLVKIKDKFYKLYSSGDTGALGYGWKSVSCETTRDKFGCLCIQQRG